MVMKRWFDNHIHVSNYGPDGTKRQDILPSLLRVLDESKADLRFIISCDDPYYRRMMQDGSQILEANRFIYDLVRRAPDRLYGSCMINPNFLDESLKVMRICFEEWGFVQLGEMLQYMHGYRMNSDGVEKILRLAAHYDVPIQVHISTSNVRQPEQPAEKPGTEQLIDLLSAAEHVPEAKYILAHAVGTKKDNPPVVDEYLDIIVGNFGKFPDNFWMEIAHFNSPGVKSVLRRVPTTKLIAGTDWTTRIGPPFLPYGMIFGMRKIEENPYPPSVDAMINLLRKAGASDVDVDRIGYQNAVKLFKICNSLLPL
jgi:predicted TIM-barrel fold metal-dependent hydrolase